jgi:LytS/YehU family sensor histidine kinase
LWFIEPTISFLESLLIGSLAVGVYVNRRTSLAAMRRMHAAEQARVAAQRRTLESQLQAMQARIEPRFLFDTLAQVHALYDLDDVRAGAMLDDLIAYLRAALPHLRRSTSTVGREVELTRAFINIAGSGADQPFEFRAVVDDAVTHAPLPGMLLLPLAQQALQHSTSLRLDAHAAAGRIKLVLVVDGSGLAPQPSNTALNALRERLHALYDDAAVLALEAVPQGGSSATLELPPQPTQDPPVAPNLRKESA